MSADEDLGHLVADLQRKVEILARASQLPFSTVPNGDDSLVLGDVVTQAVETAGALPVVADQVAIAQDSADSIAVISDDFDTQLDSILDAGDADLDGARADLEDAQQQLDDAFVQIGDLDTASQENAQAARDAQSAADDAATAATDASQAASTAQSAADAASTAASTANQAALDAAGLAASKGQVIRQVSPPTGSRATTANLWIDISTDSNGNVKNTPNLYNDSTGKWEPVTDQKVIDAATAAANAASAASTAQSTADTAKSNAATAQTAAQNAQQTANQAQQTAGTAASNAQAAIVSASAAQSTADTAKGNAATAQSTADAAKTAAATAAAKAVAVAAGVLDNGGAEFDFDSWDSSAKGTIVVQTTKVRSGAKAWQATTGGELRQGMVAVKPGDTWRLRWAVQGTGTGTRAGGLRIQKYDATASSPAWSDVGGTGSTVAVTSTTWVIQDATVTIPATGVTHIRARIAFSEPSGITTYFDDVELVNITDAKAAADAAATAQTAANTAQSTADTAKTNAATAQSTADTAKSNAATAQAAANAAQSTADTAKSNAATAQSKADQASSDAATAAGIAGGKADVLIQPTTPTAAYQKATTLWIDTTSSANTPKRWVNSAWTVVTDKAATDAASAAAAANTAAGNAKTAADNAATAASAAQQTANTAQTAANTAQSTANGKPQILFGTGTPAGTAPQGSTWFQVDSTGAVIGQWQQTAASNTGSTWTARQMASDVIAGLDVGKLSAGTAAIADAVLQKVAAGTANIQTANVSNLFVTSGATMSQAVIEYLFANVVQAHKITAGMIDVGSLNGVTLTGVTLQTGDESVKQAYASITRYTMRFTEYRSGTDTFRAIGGMSVGGSGLIALEGRDAATDSIETKVYLGDQQITWQNLPQTVGVFITDHTLVLGNLYLKSGLRFADNTEQKTAYPGPASDTGWITPTLASGFTAQNGFGYRIQGNRVEWQGAVAYSNSSTQFPAGYTTILSGLPRAAQPAQYLRRPVSIYNGYTGNAVFTGGRIDVGVSGTSGNAIYFGGLSYSND